MLCDNRCQYAMFPSCRFGDFNLLLGSIEILNVLRVNKSNWGEKFWGESRSGRPFSYQSEEQQAVQVCPQPAI